MSDHLLRKPHVWEIEYQTLDGGANRVGEKIYILTYEAAFSDAIRQWEKVRKSMHQGFSLRYVGMVINAPLLTKEDYEQ